jgi:hypothetical protein
MINNLKPWQSHTGIVLTVLLLGVLGFSIWKDRGLAFSPGPVTGMQREGLILQGFKSHSEFEKECRYCHLPLEATLGEMCLICHVEIANQANTDTGIHGQIENVIKCQACHIDHKGRDFDPTLAAIKFFDHTVTQFSLAFHEVNYDATPMACDACHIQDDYTVVDDTSCRDCHSGYDQEFTLGHLESYGENCLGCHDGVDRMRGFDHGVTGFALEGGHTPAACIECHSGERISETATTCQECHAEPEMHRGMFELTCENCHSAQGWSPATINGQLFNHLANTGFTLDKHRVDYSGQPIQCSSCHPVDLQTFEQGTCVNCHAQADLIFMEQHRQQFGADCLSCHDGVDRMIGFDHGLVFPLDGRHAEIGCIECHTNQVFAGTPGQCFQCHAEPEIHAGVFGVTCEACHTTTAWAPATLLAHSFPLGHGLDAGVQPTACATCHPNKYPEYTCYGCHEHQQEDISRKHTEEGISLAELPACVECHISGQEAEKDD